MSVLPYGGASSSGWFGAFGASAVLHGSAVLGVVGLSAGAFTVEAMPTRAAFTVTLDQLDADTLAGLIEQEGLAGAEDGNDPVITETMAVDPDVASDPAGQSEASPEGTVLELPLETPTAIQPDTLIAAPASPDVVVPSPIITETVSPLSAVETVAPVGITDGQNGVVAGEGDVIATNLTTLAQSETVASVATPPVPPTAQDLAIGDLIDRIRAAPPQTCLIALPRRDGPDGVGLAIIAAQDSAMEAFAQDVLIEQDADIRQTRTLIDPRQCPAIGFVESNDDYPAMRLGIQIDSPEVASGDTITGVLRGVAGRYLTLVLVDDNGVVTDLQRFTSYSGNLARFDIPVTRVGLTRDTRPLILAIATDRPAVAIRDRMGRLAQDIFVQAVTGNLGDAHLGLVSVDIR